MPTAVAERKPPAAHELKGLKTRRAKVAKELADLNTNYANVEEALKAIARKIDAKTAELGEIDQQIDEVKKSGPVVTEHAMLRYLERVMGIDLGQVAEDILTPEIVDQIGTLANATIPHPNGCKLVVRDRVVVTVEGVE